MSGFMVIELTVGALKDVSVVPDGYVVPVGLVTDPLMVPVKETFPNGFGFC
jgi:hypothetical protein